MATKHAALVTWSRCRGRNGWDAPQDIPGDMAEEVLNMHFYDGGIGTKRGGAISTGTLTGFTGPFNALFSWVPGQNPAARELFAVDSTATKKIGRMAAGSTLTALTVGDAIATTPQEVMAATINGKLFIAYDSTVNRLHVYDPGYSTTALRRVGLAATAAATVANTGSGSYTATIRYYRIAVTEQRSSVTVRRSNLSAAVSFTPSGSGTAARITQPTLPGEGETHWEVYASDDGVLYYGPIATTVVGTTTVDDSLEPSVYETTYSLAPEEGANTPFPSVKFLYSNGSRLFGLGVWETSAGDSHTPLAGTVYVSPVLDSSSIHDEERCSNTTTAVGRVILSRNAGGADRGLAGFGNLVMAFQDVGIYALVPTENANTPFRRVQYSSKLGAVSQRSIVEAEDELGRPAVYFLDPVRGPYRLGHDGLKWVGKDVKDIWDTVNLAASTVVAHGRYHERKRQIWWWVATGSSNDPDTMIVLDLTEQRVDDEGDLRGGWVKWTGDLAACRCSCMMATTLGASMSLGLSPYAAPATGTTLLKADTSDATDNGTQFQAYVQSGGIVVDPLIVNKALVRSHLLAKAASGVTLTQTLIRNFGDETSRTDTVSLTAAGSETRVLRKFEAAALQDACVFQVRIGDASASSSQWTLDRWYGSVEQNEVR